MNDKKYDELATKITASLKELITTDTPQESIEKITGIISEVDNLGKRHDEIADEVVSYKTKYIEQIKTFGNNEQPHDDEEPKTFEEIAQEVLSKDAKK